MRRTGSVLAKELADRAGTTRRRIQLWTDAGVLETDSPKHPGTGKQKDYSEDEVAFALIAAALSRQGITIGRIEYLVDRVRWNSRANIVDGPVVITVVRPS